MLWIVAALLVALAVWELWVCEGAHLGRGFVVAMYDLAARRYDSIKDFDWDWERRFLGEPLARAIGALASPMILDVGAGTGRTGRALLPLLSGEALLASVEPSHRMQAIGTRLLPDPRSGWLRAWADSLPFEENAFDVVVSLEMLEFTPSPRRALEEMIRVLRPGGWLLTTNRVGNQAPWILGRTTPRRQFPALLEELGMDQVETVVWQIEYDLNWAHKPHAVQTVPG